MGLRLRVVVAHATCWTMRVSRIVTCLKMSGSLRINIIENLLTIGMSATGCRPGWPLMIVAMNRPVSLWVSPVSAQRRIKVSLNRPTFLWSRIFRLALAHF